MNLRSVDGFPKSEVSIDKTIGLFGSIPLMFLKSSSRSTKP
nr:hypothetical protein [Mycoplasmopsis bovis]